MGDIVDVRPDRFLRAMRDNGDWAKSCEQSGMTTAEVEELCRVNAKFDRAQVECQLEFHEEHIIEATEAAIIRAAEQARENRRLRIEEMRSKALKNYQDRRAYYG